MSNPTELLKEAGEECTKVLAQLATNTIKVSVKNCLMPIVVDALKEAAGDAKEGGSADSKEVIVKMDRLVFDENEAQKDLFVLHLVDTPTQYPWFGNPYTSYLAYSVRVGSDKEDEGRFYCRGYRQSLRYNHLVSLGNKIKEEFKEEKEPFPALPGQLLHGYYCGCLVRNPDRYAHEPLVRNWMKAVTAKPWDGAQAPKFFGLGEDWEQAQRDREASREIILETVRSYLNRDPWWREFRDPFDETDGIRQLMCIVMDYSIMPRLRSTVNPPFCRSQALRTFEEMLSAAIDTSVGTWGAAQDGINKGKAELVALVEGQADKLKEALVPVLAKVLAKAAPKKEEAKEEKGDDKPKVGDYIANWQFGATEIGTKLGEALEKDGSALSALRGLQHALNPRTVIEEKLKTLADQVLGDGAGSNPVVEAVIGGIAREIGWSLNRFNTVDAILEAAEPFFKAVDAAYKVVEELAGKDEAAAGQAIDQISADLWESLGTSGRDLFHQYQSIRRDTKSKLDSDNTPDPAADAITDLLDELFTLHMRALNAARVTFCRRLCSNLTGDALASGDAAKAVAKEAFRFAVINNIQVVAEIQWVRTCEVLQIYAKHTAYKKFIDEIMPTLSDLLDELKGLLPDQLADMNIHITIIEKVLEVVIFKAMDIAMGKLLPLTEKNLFAQ